MSSVIIAGIDYSMLCPCICIYTPNNDPLYYFITSDKKYIGSFNNGKITGIGMLDYSCNEERFNFLSQTFIDVINKHNVTSVGLEGYAMGAKGTVFHIGENGGVLKNKLWNNKTPFTEYAPKHVKKVMVNNGNANKDFMLDFFKSDEKYVDLLSILGYTKSSIGSPISDIVDSYYIAKLHYQNLIKN